MATFSQPRDPVRVLRRRLFLLVLLVILAIAVRGVWGIFLKQSESRALRDEAQAQLTDLQKREASLRADMQRLKTDRGIEETLRTQYNLAKPGEGLIVIVEPQSQAATPAPTNWFQRTFKWW